MTITYSTTLTFPELLGENQIALADQMIDSLQAFGVETISDTGSKIELQVPAVDEGLNEPVELIIDTIVQCTEANLTFGTVNGVEEEDEIPLDGIDYDEVLLEVDTPEIW